MSAPSACALSVLHSCSWRGTVSGGPVRPLPRSARLWIHIPLCSGPLRHEGVWYSCHFSMAWEQGGHGAPWDQREATESAQLSVNAGFVLALPRAGEGSGPPLL